MGYNRVYVHTGAPLPLDWDRWWEGLRKGRCFVTNGPLLRLQANGEWPGTVFRPESEFAVTIDGQLDSRDACWPLELVVNGEARPIELPATFTIEKSGWFLVRTLSKVTHTFRFASTAPWYVERARRAMAHREDATSFFLQWAKQRRRLVGEALEDPVERDAVLADHEQAVAFWEKRLAQARNASHE